MYEKNIKVDSVYVHFEEIHSLTPNDMQSTTNVFVEVSIFSTLQTKVFVEYIYFSP